VAAGDKQMNEVSDGSNTSSAPETPIVGAQLGTSGPLRRLLQRGASNGDAFDDRILTVSSASGEHPWPGKADGDGMIALGATTPGESDFRVTSDDSAALGIAQDPAFAMTASSASHLGDMVQSDPVAAPNPADPHASRQTSAPTSLADRSIAASDVLEPPASAPWHDTPSGTHRNGELGRGTVDPGDDARSDGMSSHTQHADHRISPTLDILPLDNIVDPAPRHNSTGEDSGRPAHGSHDRSDPILSLPTSGHADAGHPNAAHPDATTALADVLKIDGASDDAGHGVGANHNDTASSGTAKLASDDATSHDAAIHQDSMTPPSTGALVESGTKAILLATDDSPNRIGPHASAADFAISAPSHVHAAAHATAAFNPGVLGARDQLASAIATATPETAAMTTLPSSQITGAAIPTLGGDVHALQKHAA